MGINGMEIIPVILGNLVYPLLPWLIKPFSDHLDRRKELFDYWLSRTSIEKMGIVNVTPAWLVLHSVPLYG